MKLINPINLKNKINNKEDFQLIDIREDYEHEICCIGGDKIGMYSIPDSIHKISKSKDVIIYCRTGSRSAIIVKMLEDNYSFDNVYNLDGGIMRWREDIDLTLKKY